MENKIKRQTKATQNPRNPGAFDCVWKLIAQGITGATVPVLLVVKGHGGNCFTKKEGK